MVPVPEEHIEEFRQILLGKILIQGGWTGERVLTECAGLDERAMRVLDYVAQCSELEQTPRFSEAAEALGMTRENVFEVVNEVEVFCQQRELPFLLLTAPRQYDGEVDRVITMPPTASQSWLAVGSSRAISNTK